VTPAPAQALQGAATVSSPVKTAREPQNSPKSGDTDRGRDELRIELLQAANAYSLSPCSPVMKANLVKALTDYASAIAEKSGCGFMMCGGSERVDAAAHMFGTSMDKRVKQAVAAAFEHGGISLKDYSAGLRLTLLMVAGEQGDAVSACARTTERKR
jgi:hypothetical protein